MTTETRQNLSFAILDAFICFLGLIMLGFVGDEELRRTQGWCAVIGGALFGVINLLVFFFQLGRESESKG